MDLLGEQIFTSCYELHDEEKDCDYFAWINPPLPNNWYKEKDCDCFA